MNYIAINSIKELDNILDTPLFITGSNKYINEEIHENTWGIALTQAVLKLVTVQDISVFLDAVINRIQKQIAQQNITATFYVWFDEMACQLRFNVISGCTDSLPFGCKLEFVDTKDVIIEAFLSSHYHAGIPFDEMNIVDIFNDDDEDEEMGHVLKVFLLCLEPKKT